MSAPCPAWCINHTPAGFVGKIPVSEVHQASRWFGPVSVALMQVADGKPYLSFNAVTIDLRETRHLAQSMQLLGHEDIAAGITELTALALTGSERVAGPVLTKTGQVVG